MTNREIFRSKSSVVAAWIMYLITGVLIVQTLLTDSLSNFVLTLVCGICIAYAFYLILHRPSVEIYDEGLVIINPFHRFEIGWSEVVAVETRYTMSVQVGARTIYAWAAPAPGRYHARNIHPSEVRGTKIPESGLVRFGESPRSDSGVAAHLVRTRWDRFKNAQGFTFTERFNSLGAITLCALALVSVILILSH